MFLPEHPSADVMRMTVRRSIAKFPMNLSDKHLRFVGLVIYANYYDCDPLKAGRIDRVDQLMPYFIMEVLGKIPGLPGLFVAVIFSAALSTMSSGFNSLAAVAYEDFLQFANIPLPAVVITKTAGEFRCSASQTSPASFPVR